jgi:hypothetical protein
MGSFRVGDLIELQIAENGSGDTTNPVTRNLAVRQSPDGSLGAHLQVLGYKTISFYHYGPAAEENLLGAWIAKMPTDATNGAVVHIEQVDVWCGDAPGADTASNHWEILISDGTTYENPVKLIGGAYATTIKYTVASDNSDGGGEHTYPVYSKKTNFDQFYDNSLPIQMEWHCEGSCGTGPSGVTVTVTYSERIKDTSP